MRTYRTDPTLSYLKRPPTLAPIVLWRASNYGRYALFLVMLTIGSAKAQFDYVINNGAITIIGYSGPGGAVIIPSSISSLPVTSIGGEAFSAFNNIVLTSVTIPDTVTNIGNGAFEDQEALTTATVPNSVSSIGSFAFYNCGLTSIVIPNQVTSIADSAFAACKSLTSVTIPNGVTNLGPGAFEYCFALESITLPDSLVSIGSYALASCQPSLGSITIPSSVITVGDRAFYNCGSLTNVCFEGNAPVDTGDAFDGDSMCLVFYVAGTTGWASTFGGITTSQCSDCASAGVKSPIAIGQSVTVPENGGVFITLTGSDQNSPALPLTDFTITTGPGQGNIETTGILDQIQFYTPNTNYTGPDSFQFSVDNGCAESSPGTVSITVAPSATVAGHVYCTCDGSPVAGATVMLGSFYATTDANGAYAIMAVPLGNYVAVVTQPSYDQTDGQVVILSDDSVVTEDFQVTPSTNPDQLDASVLKMIVPPSSVVALPVANFGTPSNPYWVSEQGGQAIEAFYVPGAGLNLSQAACRLGVDHFNWVQTITAVSYGLKFDCLPLSRTYTDPPQFLCDGEPNCIPFVTGNYCENSDNLPFYYNEGPTYAGLFNVTNQITPDGMRLTFFDEPSLIPLDEGRFVTTLVGVRKDGSFHFFPGTTFVWTSDFNGLWGGVNLVAASMLSLTPTNGSGGVESVQTNIQPADIDPEAMDVMMQTGGGFAIAIRPSTQSVVIGGSASFTVYPTNCSSSISFQWRDNEIDIPGATGSTLQLENVTGQDSGSYDVVLTDTNGVVESAPANLSVLATPRFQSVSMNANGDLVLSWIAAQRKSYELQYTTNLFQQNWIAIGNVIARDTVVYATNVVGQDSQRFYRVIQQ